MRKYTFGLFVLLILFLDAPLLANNAAFNQYIRQYKEIAVREMERTGVPTSIKLAQGLLESNAGRSTLAQKANNHFGIKCGGKWKGKTFYRKDDDYRNGRLVKSCFRKYKRATESYIAHSNFLKDNRRYGSLFSLNAKDYKAWAKGLKKAGYATSKTYANKLIKLIEEYHLYKFDYALPTGGYTPPIAVNSAKKEYRFVNDVKVVYARAGDTPNSIAERHNTNAKRIVSYNEKIDFTSTRLTEGTAVFLQKKRKKYRGRSKYHTVKQGETMYSIAQQYGIRLPKLYSRNRMPANREPAVGEAIRLKGKARKSPKLRPIKSTTKRRKNQQKTKPIAADSNNNYKPALVHTPTTSVVTTTPTTETNSSTPSPTTQQHIVQKGETLWRISQKYGMSVKDLMAKNNLQSTTIHTGTTLKIR